MGEIQVEINGKLIRCQENMTILQAAQQAGIEIPTLCHHPDLSPTGACRMCVVEVQGSKTLVGTCHTPVAAGMVILTHSPKVLAVRRAVVELLQAAHDAVCVTDPTCQHCELHNLCSELQIQRHGYRVRQRRTYPIEELNPYVRRDLSKCILCRLCIQACTEIAKKNVLATGYRGYPSKVIVDCDVSLTTEVCRDCGICIDYCPTHALSRPLVVEFQHD